MSKINKYDEYLLEQKIYQLLLESKVVYSNKFIKLLKRMKGDKIASTILDLYSKDVDGLTQNYVDVTDVKDTVSFTPDRKAQEILDEGPTYWKVIQQGRTLTHGDANDKIFARLGYDKTKNEHYSPPANTIGLILNETISETSGNIYVLFEEKDQKKLSCVNKEALALSDEKSKKIWSSNRNNIKIGRFVRSILNAAGVAFTAPELEKFINVYKATFDFEADAIKQFDVVKGDKIAYWYYYERYVEGEGTLNNSCMSEVSSDYLDIYTSNPKVVSMVILYGDEGTIKEDGTYKDDLIKGRAILWEASVNGKDIKFMDRIYTVLDSDVELFKQYGEKNGFWWKTSQNMSPDTAITNGSETITNPSITVNIDNGEHEMYPYVDTMCYLNNKFNRLTNFEDKSVERLLKDTGGGWDEVDY